MGATHLRNIIIGVVILVVAFLFRDQLVEAAPNLIYYIVLLAGLALVAYGVLGYVKSGSRDSAEPGASERTLANEVLLKALARMAYADTNIAPSEVSTIQKIFEETTGEAISVGDVRVGARADIYEDHAFEKYLRKIRKSLSDDDKKMIMMAMAKVIRADGNVSPFEVGFFNEVCGALKVPPALLSDLETDEDEPDTVKAADIPPEMLGEKPPPPPADEDVGGDDDDEPATLKVEEEDESTAESAKEDEDQTRG